LYDVQYTFKATLIGTKQVLTSGVYCELYYRLMRDGQATMMKVYDHCCFVKDF